MHVEEHIKYLNVPQNLKGNCIVLITLTFRTVILPQHAVIPELAAVVAALDPEAVVPPIIEAIEAPEVTEAEGNPEAGGKLDHRTTLQVEVEV